MIAAISSRANKIWAGYSLIRSITRVSEARGGLLARKNGVIEQLMKAFAEMILRIWQSVEKQALSITGQGYVDWLRVDWRKVSQCFQCFKGGRRKIDNYPTERLHRGNLWGHPTARQIDHGGRAPRPGAASPLYPCSAQQARISGKSHFRSRPFSLLKAIEPSKNREVSIGKSGVGGVLALTAQEYRAGLAYWRVFAGALAFPNIEFGVGVHMLRRAFGGGRFPTG